jgi:hypothetical protein
MKRAGKVLILVFLCSPVAALAQNFELAPFFGYRFGGSIDENFETPLELIADVEVDEDVSYGLGAYWEISSNSEVGVRWSHNPTALMFEPVGGFEPLIAFDMDIDTIHGEFLIGGNRRSRNWAYLILGLGATILSPDGDLDSETRFSGTIGGGFRFGFSPRVGLRLEGRWLPTYLYSTDAGYWCDPFFGCYVVADDTFLSQFEGAAAIGIRF